MTAVVSLRLADPKAKSCDARPCGTSIGGELSSASIPGFGAVPRPNSYAIRAEMHSTAISTAEALVGTEAFLPLPAIGCDRG
jgi:hypothetical protein